MSMALMFMIFLEFSVTFLGVAITDVLLKNAERERRVKFNKKPEECLANPELINEIFSPKKNGKCCFSGYFSTSEAN